MPVFTIHHITKYQYDRPIKESINEIKIYPLADHTQEILHQELLISHHPQVETHTDYWGNKVGTFSIAAPHKEMLIESKLIVRTIHAQEIDLNTTALPESLASHKTASLQLLELSLPDHIEKQDELNQILQSLPIAANTSIVAITQLCSQYIYQHFTYRKGITNIETTIDEILTVQAGVCQDFAHVLLQMLRSLGIPARYVSGYICPNKNGMRGEGATHAWVEVYIPETGWAGIDPTNNIWVANTHVKLSTGKNFADCTPAKGTFKGPARQQLSVYVSIGYEDGHVFEDLNQVALKVDTENLVALVTEDYIMEQQQQ